MNNPDKLNSMQLDILVEIASIGSGNAVTSLSKLLRKKVEMVVPVVKFIEFKDIANFIGGAEQIVIGVLVGLSGDVNGMMMFLVDHESARKLLSMIMKEEYKPDAKFTEMELSTMTEIGNILNSSYLSSLSALIDITIEQSVPYCSIDMANAILSVPAIEYGAISDKALFIDSVFKADEANVSGYFILVPDMPSFKNIFSKLGAGS